MKSTKKQNKSRGINELLDPISIDENGNRVLDGEAYQTDCPLCKGELNWGMEGKKIVCDKCGQVWEESETMNELKLLQEIASNTKKIMEMLEEMNKPKTIPINLISCLDREAIKKLLESPEGLEILKVHQRP